MTKPTPIVGTEVSLKHTIISAVPLRGALVERAGERSVRPVPIPWPVPEVLSKGKAPGAVDGVGSAGCLSLLHGGDIGAKDLSLHGSAVGIHSLDDDVGSY